MEVKALYTRDELPADLLSQVQPVFADANEGALEIYFNIKRAFNCLLGIELVFSDDLCVCVNRSMERLRAADKWKGIWL